MKIRDMKTVKYITFVMATAGLTLTSCDLDHEPDERVNMVETNQVIQLLSTAYSDGNYGWICEASSDNIVDINAPYMATQSNGTEIEVRYNKSSAERMDDELYRFEPVKSSDDTDSPSSVWEGCYHAIAVANHAISILDEIKAKNGGQEDAQMRAAYGEAYLSRAYHHFILVNVFSQAYRNDQLSQADKGIPYVTQPEDKVSVNYDRGTVTETYNKIQADLEEGLKRVSDNIYTKPKWHFNANAAHAFAARFYLFKRQYDKVIEHANAVLGTDRSTLPTMLMSYATFDDATTLANYANIWQDPESPNNLLLIDTHSIHFRRSVGYRYATAGRALRDIIYHLGPNWRWYCMPCAGVGGETFYDGESGDHGYSSSRIGERFEYTNKVAGIGWAHVIRREFTCTTLLLERAEAELLGNKDVAACVADLIAYENSRQTFSEKTKQFYTNGNALQPLTQAMIESWYADYTHSNTLTAEQWAATQNMSPDFIIPDDLLVYWNCLNDMRRYETGWTGLRFFDLKRWGLPIEHHYNPENTVFRLEWNDPRRAIEVPQDVLVAGMSSSQTPLVSNISTPARFSNFQYQK